jgi:hypothetical protein
LVLPTSLKLGLASPQPFLCHLPEHCLGANREFRLAAHLLLLFLFWCTLTGFEGLAAVIVAPLEFGQVQVARRFWSDVSKAVLR